MRSGTRSGAGRGERAAGDPPRELACEVVPELPPCAAVLTLSRPPPPPPPPPPILAAMAFAATMESLAAAASSFSVASTDCAPTCSAG